MDRNLVSLGLVILVSILAAGFFFVPFPTSAFQGYAPAGVVIPDADIILDGGFEGSIETTTITNPNWQSTSTNFITSLCSLNFCGNDTPSAPRTGTFFAWFGGSVAAETGTATQTLVIPSGSNPVLKYWLRINTVTSPFDARLEIKVDGMVIQTVTEPSAAEGAYSQRTVSLPIMFANGASHVISFEYDNPAGSGISNFTVDDITLETTGVVTPTPTATPTPAPGCLTTINYSGPVVEIPDNLAAGVNIVVPVSGLTGNISDLDFRFDGTPSVDATATTVGVNHSYVGDLRFTLTSPAGTSVSFLDRPGFPAAGAGCDNNNLAALTLDDDGGFPPIENQCVGAIDAALPSGSFSPNAALSAFDGQTANGNWTLNVSDNLEQDTGSVRVFSLLFRSACPANAVVSGRVFTPNGLVIRSAAVALTDSLGVRRTTTTSSFGTYSFSNVETGQTYIMGVSSRRYRFSPRQLTVNGNLADVDFFGLE